MTFQEFVEPNGRGLKWFGGTVAFIAALNVTFAFLPVPKSVVPVVGLVAVVVLMVAPIFAVFKAGDYDWTAKKAGLMVLCGFLAQALCLWLSNTVFKGMAISAVTFALSQIGLMVWCVGLGALLATLVKDKNLLIPISIFLAAFDVFLVLTPMGFTQKIMKAAPQILEQGGYRVAQVAENPAMGPVGAYAYVGPADFVFMGMFFFALYRYQMRVRQTLAWLIPALLAYLAFVIFTGISMPALVPIGLVTLIVNLPEFKLKKDEWLSTGLIAAIAAGLLIFAFTRPKPPVEPLQTGASQASPESEGSPGPSEPGRFPSPVPDDEGSTPDRR